MAPNPAIIEAVEKLGYRVTPGDVAAQAGINVDLAHQGLLALATDAGGHMQVAESGDVVYLFPKHFQAILRSKYFQIKLKKWWEKIWAVLFYLIRISFGILLIASIALISIAIMVIVIGSLFSSDSDGGSIGGGGSSGGGSSGGGSSGGGGWFYFPDIFWYLSPDYNTHYQQRRREKKELNFFEAIFSFLFGDGNPNSNLEKRRWQSIAKVIRRHRGAIVAEQISPYLDDIGPTYAQEYEDYMLPVLTRFNGQPQVSPEGQIVYYFPELQITTRKRPAPPASQFLEELPWRFSAASSGQIILAIGLGGVNLVGALVLGNLLKTAAIAGGFIGFIQGIYWLLIFYGVGFLTIPLIRYFWIQWRNSKINTRNDSRFSRTKLIASADSVLKQKIEFAKQFASQKVIGKKDIAYTTEEDLLEQEFNHGFKGLEDSTDS
jgi:hypothetical protein